jgi:hypothetical protein
MIGYGDVTLSEVCDRLALLSEGYHRAAGRRIVKQIERRTLRSSPDYGRLLAQAQTHARLGTLIDTATAEFDARPPVTYKQGKAARKRKPIV